MLIARRLIVAAIALLLAVQVVRNAAVDALASMRPDAAAQMWAGHPDVQISAGLTAIGTAARQQRPIDDTIFAMIGDAAVKAPLSPAPFLVRGVQAQTSGDPEAARRAFLAAQRRDPRSLPAAYFLADHFFRSNRLMEGLQQTAIVARLAPNGAAAVAPYIATYASNRANWPQVRQLFEQQEGLEADVLMALAQDGRNAEAVLALADAEHRKPDSRWLPVLMNSLIAQGEYSRARAVWAQVGAPRKQSQGLIYDTGFAEPGAPPPFNWNLVTSGTGLAERQPGGRLRILFYGNQDGALASQLLVLAPGTYRLQMHIVGTPAHAETLAWQLRCNKTGEPFARAGLADIARQGWTFEVPANCPAQWLELVGRAGDVAQQADVTIGGLRLTRSSGNA